jgi:preprotein translocase subunit YajC
MASYWVGQRLTTKSGISGTVRTIEPGKIIVKLDNGRLATIKTN